MANHFISPSVYPPPPIYNSPPIYASPEHKHHKRESTQTHCTKKRSPETIGELLSVALIAIGTDCCDVGLSEKAKGGAQKDRELLLQFTNR